MKKLAILLVGAAMITACAQSVSVDTSALRKTQFDSWVQANNDGTWKETGMGSWIISYTDGPKVTPIGTHETNPYVRANYVVTDLKGNITLHNSAEVAKQLREYKEYNWYKPNPLRRDKGYEYAGLTEILDQMYIGDRCKVAIPAWLLSNKEYGSAEEYLKNFSGGVESAIYDIEVVEVIPDFNKWQRNILETYAGCELEELIEDGVYFKKIVDAGEDAKEIESGATVSVNYVCRRWDGQVVDTNIKEIALEAFGSEMKGSSFSPMKVTWADNYGEIKTTSNGTLIPGFTRGLKALKYGEKGMAFLYSDYAYGAQGSGSKIPPFCPLIFELEIAEKE